jgi:4-hydroxybenzoate polyprenyltransferase
MNISSFPQSVTVGVKGESVRFPLRKILDCFFLLRIPLLVPVWTILILGWIAGNAEAGLGGLFAGTSSLSASGWLVVTSFSLIVASIYVVNQIVDIENDRINHKLFLLPHGFVSVRTAWVLSVVCALSGLLLPLLFIQNFAFIPLFLGSLLLGALYNLPPVQLKNRPFGGLFANALGHGMLTFMVGWYVASGNNPLNWSYLVAGLLSGLAPTLANGAVYLATTIPDATGDRLTDKKTFCVSFGEKKTAVVSVMFCTGAFISSFFMLYHSWVMAVPAGVSLLLFGMFAVSTGRKHAFNAFRWPVFLLSAFVALFVPEYGILILLTFFGSKAYYKWRFGIDYPTLKAK